MSEGGPLARVTDHDVGVGLGELRLHFQADVGQHGRQFAGGDRDVDVVGQPVQRDVHRRSLSSRLLAAAAFGRDRTGHDTRPAGGVNIPGGPGSPGSGDGEG